MDKKSESLIESVEQNLKESNSKFKDLEIESRHVEKTQSESSKIQIKDDSSINKQSSKKPNKQTNIQPNPNTQYCHHIFYHPIVPQIPPNSNQSKNQSVEKLKKKSHCDDEKTKRQNKCVNIFDTRRISNTLSWILIILISVIIIYSLVFILFDYPMICTSPNLKETPGMQTILVYKRPNPPNAQTQ